MELLLCLAKHCIDMASSQYCSHNTLSDGEKYNDLKQSHLQDLYNLEMFKWKVSAELFLKSLSLSFFICGCLKWLEALWRIKGEQKHNPDFFFHDNSIAYLYICCLGDVLLGENSVLIQAFDSYI